MKLIDVDALRADYGMADDCKDCETGYRSCEYDRIYSKMDFCGWLDDAPTVDAVPVRCKDCRWRDNQDGSTAWMPCRALVTPNDFYCPRGERKDGDA